MWKKIICTRLKSMNFPQSRRVQCMICKRVLILIRAAARCHRDFLRRWAFLLWRMHGFSSGATPNGSKRAIDNWDLIPLHCCTRSQSAFNQGTCQLVCCNTCTKSSRESVGNRSELRKKSSMQSRWLGVRAFGQWLSSQIYVPRSSTGQGACLF
jgi:hypothetical protein